MVSHIITSGEIISEGMPSVASKKVVDDLRKNFDGLIITDEIHMLGLKNFYGTIDEMYVGVFKAGNDVVLNFDNNPNEIYRMIQVVKAVRGKGRNTGYADRCIGEKNIRSERIRGHQLIFWRGAW